MSAGRHARPRERRPSRLRSARWRWYRLPLPLAVLVVLLMPWTAVRDMRQSTSAFRSLCDVFLIARRQEQEAAAASPPPRTRHLYLVRSGSQS